MKITKDYVFSVIERLGRAVSKKAEELAPPPTAKPLLTSTGRTILSASQSVQKSIANELWRIQKKVAYGDIRPVAAMAELHTVCEHHKLLIEEDWQNLIRSIVV